MSRRKWVSAFLKGNESVPPLTEEEKAKLGDEEIVLLLSGYNNFGDKIYNYIKLKFKNIEPLVLAVENGGRFDLHEYGEVVAAGMGNPPPEVRQEMESQYKMVRLANQEGA